LCDGAEKSQQELNLRKSGEGIRQNLTQLQLGCSLFGKTPKSISNFDDSLGIESLQSEDKSVSNDNIKDKKTILNRKGRVPS